jgi:hypothetical protein
MWKVGDHVLGRKGSEDFLYPGEVRHLDGERCFVVFYDGDDGMVEASELKALELHVGCKLFARQPTERTFTPAEVLDCDDFMVNVRWHDGAENWISYAMIRMR